jgi:hypothetical protein
MDRTIDKSSINKQRNGRFLRWGLIALAVLAAVWFGLR